MDDLEGFRPSVEEAATGVDTARGPEWEPQPPDVTELQPSQDHTSAGGVAFHGRAKQGVS